MQAEGVVKVSTKGQIVIPKEVRVRFGIKPGRRMIIAVRRNEILLRTVEEIPLEEISKKSSRIARRENVEIEALVNEAIRWARNSE
jgi:AbrB family looped-hinge helix DNA binding protein